MVVVKAWDILKILTLVGISLSLSNCSDCDAECFQGRNNVVTTPPEAGNEDVTSTESDVVVENADVVIEQPLDPSGAGGSLENKTAWTPGESGFDNSFQTPSIDSEQENDDFSESTTPGIDEPGNVDIVDIDDTDDPSSPSACDGRTDTVKKVYRVAFPARKGCSYGEGENLSKKDLSIRAYASQKVTIDLPADQEVCRMDYVTRSDEFYHDDFVFLTMNENILTMSQNRFQDKFISQDGLLKWDFSRFRDESQNLSGAWFSQSQPWCIEGTSCEVPSTEETGLFSFAGNLLANSKLTESLASSGSFDVRMMTTGDNDSYDCQHTGLEFDLIVESYDKP
ncbi:MAG: hypothetical protein AB8C84_11825 [Oligoflexales bacterium]